MEICENISPADLRKPLAHLFELAAAKIVVLNKRWRTADGAPVITIRGKYTTREWTQWTQGFQYGSALLAYDLTREKRLLATGRDQTLRDMAPHLTHTGVHDHGFNNVSTYGQLRRLMLDGRIHRNDEELRFYELALKVSGAVQASRWTTLPDGGYIHSFNGRHSLFIDTIRTLRACGLAHTLGHQLRGEQDQKINLLRRLLQHATTTARYNIYYGEGRDSYDTKEQCGRVAHEAIFNPLSGAYRCPSSQQGYSPFTTWTRGLGWAMLGFTEQLEFLRSLPEKDFEAFGTRKARELALIEKAALVTCDFYIHQATASDGLCYWDTGAPNLYKLGDWRRIPADPYNQYEPVDASASAIAAQGLIRLGAVLGNKGKHYTAAGLTVTHRLLEEPYLSRDRNHEGLLLHCVYHRPNGWDYIPKGSSIPAGESCMWGDYHLLELGLLIWRLAEKKYYTFF
jgi:unsaturated chondroitin disaccharide hydrolase